MFENTHRHQLNMDDLKQELVFSFKCIHTAQTLHLTYLHLGDFLRIQQWQFFITMRYLNLKLLCCRHTDHWSKLGVLTNSSKFIPPTAPKHLLQGLRRKAD
ncbi:hypothetical protein FGO68_gene2282 [Halteria grandinella]|uniref:Uncharacterized protein n=1 Tax=Halteria grandinella TaxID=5974 RepID=A0A8J8T1S6_HALGN|nr:hypothetical protein FGO68_gene2282 [Halteria grandinella]